MTKKILGHKEARAAFKKKVLEIKRAAKIKRMTSCPTCRKMTGRQREEWEEHKKKAHGLRKFYIADTVLGTESIDGDSGYITKKVASTKPFGHARTTSRTTIMARNKREALLRNKHQFD